MAVKELTYEQQLQYLKGVTTRTGGLHEAQVLQLKLWPYTVDPEISDTKAEVDVAHKAIDYHWVLLSRPRKWSPDKRYTGRLEALVSSVKWMLGDTWKVQVFMNGERIFPLNVRKKSSKPKPGARRRK